MKNLLKPKFRFGLDLDDTCNIWMDEYKKIYPNQTQDKQITKNVRKLCLERKWWLSLPVKHRPNFEVKLYCTKRISPKSYSSKWLENNDYPKAPIYQIFSQTANKAWYIKGKVDCFVDDSIRNCIQMNLSGIPCLLMDTPWNQDYGPIGRVYSLDLNELEDVYDMFKYQIFPNYKEYFL